MRRLIAGVAPSLILSTGVVLLDRKATLDRGKGENFARITHSDTAIQRPLQAFRRYSDVPPMVVVGLAMAATAPIAMTMAMASVFLA